jgi:Zn-dependent M16 (insulinase) family peptidase
MRYYLLGMSDEERQKIRDQVLNTSLEDFHQFGQVLEEVSQNSAVVVLGSANAIQSASILTDVKKVL